MEFVCPNLFLIMHLMPPSCVGERNESNLLLLEGFKKKNRTMHSPLQGTSHNYTTVPCQHYVEDYQVNSSEI